MSDARRNSLVWCGLLLVATSCGGRLLVDSDGIHGSGGSGGAGSGGSVETGGAGGEIGSGGSVEDGGAQPTGGVAATGGDTGVEAGASGGALGTGGVTSTGGASSAGGMTSTGGAAGTGGIATGGVQGTGGGGFADAGHCFDGKKDSTESDIDCGGECAGCGPGQVCYFDSDCSATAVGCDTCYCDANTSTCVYSHCYDHKKDSNETDLDCGGTCHPCAEGQGCLIDADCTNQACDSWTHWCVPDQCGDHHKNGRESDIDCGGGACASCLVGQKCNSNFDCVSGHFCNGGKICQ